MMGKKGNTMNWNFLITFGIGIAVYLLGLLIFTLIKRHKNKKKFNKEVEEHDDKETKD